MVITYNLDLLKDPPWLEKYIESGELIYITPERVCPETDRNLPRLQDVEVSSITHKLKKNFGRESNTIGSAESDEALANFEREFTNPNIGFKDGMYGLVYFPVMEAGVPKIENNGGWHKNYTAINLDAETLPGVIVDFAPNVPDIRRKEIHQELQNAENKPENQVTKVPVTDGDKKSSILNYKALHEEATRTNYTPIASLSLEEYLMRQAKKCLGIDSSDTRRNLIDNVLGVKSPYRKIAHPLQGRARNIQKWLDENYPKEGTTYNSLYGKYNFHSDEWPGFKPLTQQTPFKLFDNSDTLWKYKVIKIKELNRGLGDLSRHVNQAFNDGDTTNFGVIICVDSPVNSFKELKDARKKVINATIPIVNSLNHTISYRVSKEKGKLLDVDLQRVEIIGLFAQGDNETGGMIPLHEYKK